MVKGLIGGVLIGAIWAASLAWVYSMTRSKWHDLGVTSGYTSGQSDILHELCTFSSQTAPQREPDWSFGVKSSGLSVTRHGDLVAIHCVP